MDINGYLNLVPSENYRMPKFMGFLEAILNPVMDLQDVIKNYSSFDANTAAGNQLDIVGEIIGVKREISFIPESGIPFMTDDQYSLALKLRMAQEAWDGTNGKAADIYEQTVGDRINIDYEDLMDCHMDINVDVEGQEIAQMFSSAGVFLVPAGVDVTVAVNDEPSTENSYYGIAVTGISYELSVGGGE